MSYCQSMVNLEPSSCRFPSLPDGPEDLRLRGLLQVNALGVAAALNVEHALVGPAVLVVTNEWAVGVSGQGGLTRACMDGGWGGRGQVSGLMGSPFPHYC